MNVEGATFEGNEGYAVGSFGSFPGAYMYFDRCRFLAAGRTGYLFDDLAGEGTFTNCLFDGGASAINGIYVDVDHCTFLRQTANPVSFIDDLARDKPLGFSIYDEPFVLFFDESGNAVCLQDRCPHRAARLSDGHVVGGRIECFYHGWQYDGSGRCRHIPQLAPSTAIPSKACVRNFPVAVRQGIVWMWPGDAASADETKIPTTSDLDAPGVFRVDFQMDLPYDQTYFIENVIDVAHIHIAHDGMRGGGLRALAKPMRFDVRTNDITGIVSAFRTIGLDDAEGVVASAEGEARVEFVAPNLIRYTSVYKNSSLIAGLALYSIPFGKSRCRMLYRKYSNFFSSRERWKPRWLEHWTQCLILEQDMSVVIGQYEGIERSEQELRRLWMPLDTSDRLVVEYRRWLDRFGASLPFYRGFRTARREDEVSGRTPAPRGRVAQHTRVCATCSRMHRRLQSATKGLWGLVAVAAAVGIGYAGTGTARVAVGLAIASVGLALASSWMQRKFE
jgi:phenylpropionate dioxygenase-like ring-hydroxylating dioxygenase large terminal subunit